MELHRMGRECYDKTDENSIDRGRIAGIGLCGGGIYPVWFHCLTGFCVLPLV